MEELEKDIVKSKRESGDMGEMLLPTLDVSSLQNRTFINDPDERGEQVRATIESMKPTGNKTADGKEELFRFWCRSGEKTFEEVMTYNKMLEWCERDIERDGYFTISKLREHRKNVKASRGYEVLVEWGDGTCTWNELGTTFQDDPRYMQKKRDCCQHQDGNSVSDMSRTKRYYKG